MKLRGLIASGTAVVAVLLVTATPSAASGRVHRAATTGAGASAATAVAPSELTETLSRSTLTAGEDVTVSGRLTDTGSGTGRAGVVTLWSRVAGSTDWRQAASATSAGDGTVSFVRTPTRSVSFQLRHAQDATSAASVSPVRDLGVRPLLTARLHPDAVRIGHTATIDGTMTPALQGRYLRLERRVDGSWTRVAGRRLSSSGGYSFSVTPSTTGFRTYRVVRRADATHLAAVARAGRLDVFRLHTYVVRTKGTITADLSLFRTIVAATYADERGWMRGHHRFLRVSSGGDFTVVLSQAKYLPTYSSVCSSLYSCRVGRYVIINQTRWLHSSPYFTGTLAQYRRMVVNHETGHWLGLHHAYCSSPGALAPVMQQQSKGMQGCLPNAWPLPGEIRAVS
ncbi:MAG: hypothetical protein QOE01_1489 [Actinomycetota bacterium]|jgi:hypothetical protein|nr:hypothetical protein [Actinomycetota bacterium]